MDGMHPLCPRLAGGSTFGRSGIMSWLPSPNYCGLSKMSQKDWVTYLFLIDPVVQSEVGYLQSRILPPQKLFGTSIELQLRHLEHLELFTVQSSSIFNSPLYIYKTIAFSFLASTTTASSESSLFSEISTLRLVRFFSWWWIWKSKKASLLRWLMMI